MKRIIILIGIIVLSVWSIQFGVAEEETNISFSLDGLENLEKAYLSEEAKGLLKQNGFVVVPGYKDEIYDIYAECKDQKQPVFVTTDAVLHTSHIFFDYLLRILEIEKLYDSAQELTDKMINISVQQYNEAKNKDIKESARLNIGFFAVAKKIFDPEYKVGYGLDGLVNKEIEKIEKHEGLKVRALLTYIKNPDLISTPYAYEDFSQYLPRGHYTRNEKFKKYFKVMMWYGRIDFKLRPGADKPATTCGKKMTLQALLITDALLKNKEAYKLWQMIYEPTVYFVGKTDDLYIDDYTKLIKEVYSTEGSIDKYTDKIKLEKFIEEAIKLRPPKILSGAAFVEHGEFAASTKGFRFMGQRFIPDSYIFQELVYGVKGGKEILKYTGKGKPFTMENTQLGPVRAFPRGLDILAVFGSKRALSILEKEGDTEYTYYYEQLEKLKKEFTYKSIEEWKQNLYWRWLYALVPLLQEDSAEPRFMQCPAWIDKELQTALGSWAELRHDTILYAKQSHTMMVTCMPGPPPEPKIVYGYVEPYPEVYMRIEEMMRDLRTNLLNLGIVIEGVPEKIKDFENTLAKLKLISEKELSGKQITTEEYEFINNIGSILASSKRFPHQIMENITSGTDEKMDAIADVHTDGNTGRVLEEGVGSPYNIYVIIEDTKGYRLCRGGVFSYYEFKHPMADRLTDEKWQDMGKKETRPNQPEWIKTFSTQNNQ